MRKYVSLLIILFFISCNCKKGTAQASMDKIALAKADCPEKATCTIKILKNKSMDVKTDDLGRPAYTVVESTTKSVIQYEFNRGDEQKYPDSGYREVVIFEINQANPEVALSGVDLQATKMLYGRFCFCRGATGLYPIIDGNLSIKKQDSSLLMELDYKTGEIPQIIKSISAVIK
ncbi:MAG TPA: hypothetical protein VK623_08110 [Flavobacterium sp.]|nr:hypothetical protein [Flavobacterium sp.]